MNRQWKSISRTRTRAVTFGATVLVVVGGLISMVGAACNNAVVDPRAIEIGIQYLVGPVLLIAGTVVLARRRSGPATA